MAKYEVRKGRTVLTLKGTAHEGGKIELRNLSGDNDEVKQKKIDALVKIGALKEVPLTEAEAAKLAEAEEKRAKAREEVEKLRLEAVEKARVRNEAADKLEAEKVKAEEAKTLKEKEDAEALELEEAEAKAAWEKAIIESDFDEMNKDPMIAFAKKYDIELKGSLVDDIRAELKELQESLTAPKE